MAAAAFMGTCLTVLILLSFPWQTQTIPNNQLPSEGDLRLISSQKDFSIENGLNNNKLRDLRLRNLILNRYEGRQKDWILKRQKNVKGVSNRCLDDILAVVIAANKTYPELWALKYLDSFGREEAGILYGNTRWAGSFDECVETLSNNTKHKFRGRYCRITVETLPIPNLAWDIGICLPDSCSSQDAKSLADDYRNFTGEAPVEKAECLSYPDFKNDKRAIAATVILSFFGALVLLATVVDYAIVAYNQYSKPPTLVKDISGSVNHGFVTNSKHDFVNANDEKPSLPQQQENDDTFTPGVGLKVLLAFSLYTNIPKLMSTKQPKSTLQCINGIRVLTTTWIVLAHTYGDMSPIRVANLVEVGRNWAPRFALQVIVNAWVSVDTWFLLSGLLTAYLFMRTLDRQKGKVKAFTMVMYYVHRFIRLTPVMMIVVMMLACYHDYYGYGPFKEIKQLDVNCRTQWWRNLIYINNFPSKKDVGTQLCFLNGWYLPVDFQLYIVSPLILIPLYKFPIIGLLINFLFLCVHFIANAVINSRVFGKDGSFDSVTDMVDVYFAPWCRVGPYVIGVFVGYVCFRTKMKLRIHPILVIIGWAISIFLGIAVVYARFAVFKRNLFFFGLPWSRNFTIFYETVYRPAWAVAVGWMIFACVHGYGGLVNIFLSWKFWVPLGRLTYCVYLFHGITQRIYWQNGKRTVAATDLTQVWDYCGFVVYSFMAAIVLSSVFEAPVGGLEELIVGNKRRGGESRTAKLSEEQETFAAELTKLPGRLQTIVRRRTESFTKESHNVTPF